MKAVKSFEDTSFGILPIPTSFESQSNYVTKENQRKDLKPIVISQPEGPSWTVQDSNTVLWQRWRLQVGFNSREGITLHGLSFDDRPVLHRLSLCEMVVPYGLLPLSISMDSDYWICSIHRGSAQSALPEKRIRCGRRRLGPQCQLAGAGLRLLGSHPLLRRQSGARQWRAFCHQECGSSLADNIFGKYGGF